MIRVCIVCSLKVKLNIDLSFSEVRRLFKIKFINAYTHREKESGRAHERSYENSKLINTNFGSVFVAKYIYMMHQILDL